MEYEPWNFFFPILPHTTRTRHTQCGAWAHWLLHTAPNASEWWAEVWAEGSTGVGDTTFFRAKQQESCQQTLRPCSIMCCFEAVLGHDALLMSSMGSSGENDDTESPHEKWGDSCLRLNRHSSTVSRPGKCFNSLKSHPDYLKNVPGKSCYLQRINMEL